MRKGILILTTVLVLVSLTGCGVPEEDYDAVRAEHDALQEDYNAVCAERDALQEERNAVLAERDALQVDYDAVCMERDALQTEVQELKSIVPPKGTDKVQVKIGGYFVATVRSVCSDYFSDPTPKVAIVSLFQGGPCIVYTGEFTEQLEIGKLYAFEVREETVTMTRTEYDYLSGPGQFDELIRRSLITGVREASEDEDGLDFNQIVIELLDEK